MIKNRKDICARLAGLAFGLFVMAMGIALCIRAGLGITPISCPPYVLSLALPFTVGQFTMMMHLVLILGQWVLLRGLRPAQWLQLVLAVVFGLFIDGCMWLTESLAPYNYLMQIFVLLAGNVLLALGMYFEIQSRLILVPTDGFVQAVCSYGHTFSHIKIAFDISLLLISVAISKLLLGHIEGIREGTLISAFAVGWFLGIIRSLMDRIRKERTGISA